VARAILDTGYLTLTVRHLQLKNGVYLYYRRIPEDLRAHYGGKRFIRKSLKTKELRCVVPG
jgi:hypothetical protein